MKKIATVLCVAACLVAGHADAQTPQQNAALRYWMAFAAMQNPPADQATADLLERVSTGDAPWDEARLGKILDANGEALAILQRGTMLPTCDWGLEYELGSETPIYYVSRARVLGRLNVLEGTRLSAQGRTGQAVDVWLAGLRFSQHITQNGTFLSMLVAERVLTPTLDAIVRAAPSIDPAHRAQVQAALRALPDEGFAWDVAKAREQAMVDAALRRGEQAMMPGDTQINAVRQRIRASRQQAIDATR